MTSLRLAGPSCSWFRCKNTDVIHSLQAKIEQLENAVNSQLNQATVERATIASLRGELKSATCNFDAHVKDLEATETTKSKTILELQTKNRELEGRLESLNCIVATLQRSERSGEEGNPRRTASVDSSSTTPRKWSFALSGTPCHLIITSVILRTAILQFLGGRDLWQLVLILRL